MRVRFYGKLAAIMGPNIEVAINTPCTVDQVRRSLVTDHPAFAELMADKRVRPIVGDSVVADSYRLAPTDELEFLAPVSGG